MPPPSWPEMIEYSLEVDFMIAREQPRRQYAKPLLGRDRWACPKDEPNPTRACMEHCANFIKDHGSSPFVNVVGGVAISDDIPGPGDDPFDTIVQTSHRANVLPRHCYWHFCPSSRAETRSGAPREYDWVSVTLRSPYRSFRNILPPPDNGKAVAKNDSDDSEFTLPPIPPPGSYGTTEMERCLALLRAGTKMFVNSTCEVRIHLNHSGPRGLGLTEAKKMITWMWLQERPLFAAIRPEVRSDVSRPRLFTESSNLAGKQSKLPSQESRGVTPSLLKQCLESTRPFPTLLSETMDTWIPDFVRPEVKERIHFIWNANTLEDLAALISVPKDESTIAINLHGAKYRPTFEFRYAHWHPQKENMQYWLLLVGRMFFYVVGEAATSFKNRIGTIERHRPQLGKELSQESWKTTMTHSCHNVYSYYWDENFVKEYRSGGVLTPMRLDCQGILDPVKGINYDSEKGKIDDGRSTLSKLFTAT